MAATWVETEVAMIGYFDDINRQAYHKSLLSYS
jgi:hypothetical protein